MDKAIENAFGIFKQSGIASKCVDILRVKYKLAKSLLLQIEGNPDWEEFYTKTLPKEIKQRECDLNVDFDTLFTEIEKNLSECKTNPIELYNYCLSLLTPFAYFLLMVKPSKHRERERQMKMDDIKLLLGSKSDEDKALANKIQSDVESMITDWENTEKVLWEISNKHIKIPTEELERYFEENYTETILVKLLRMLKEYAIKLDWILAQIGIDLLKLQNDGGIYLIESRNIYDYIQFAGTKDIAQRVFDAFPDNGGTNKSSNLPKELNTVEAKELLQKAIQAGLCSDTYKWLGAKALLAYFADKANEYLNLYKGEYDGNKKISWKPFETLFCANGLSGARRDYQKTGTLPSDHNVVDNLF